MKKFVRLVLIVAFLVLVALVLREPIMNYWNAHHSTKTPHVHLRHKQLKNVLIINDNGIPISELRHEVNNGHAYILLFIQNQNGEQQVSTISSMEFLISKGDNRFGFIDMTSMAYSNFYIARFSSKTNQLFYTSLRAEKVSTIEINREYLVGEVLSYPKNQNKVAGTVILTNGQKKELHIISMPIQAISEAHLVFVKHL